MIKCSQSLLTSQARHSISILTNYHKSIVRWLCHKVGVPNRPISNHPSFSSLKHLAFHGEVYPVVNDGHLHKNITWFVDPFLHFTTVLRLYGYRGPSNALCLLKQLNISPLLYLLASCKFAALAERIGWHFANWFVLTRHASKQNVKSIITMMYNLLK